MIKNVTFIGSILVLGKNSEITNCVFLLEE